MKRKSIKEILTEAGRHQEVLDVLKYLIDSTDYDYPVDLYVIDNTNKIDEYLTTDRVLADDVRNEAMLLFYMIESEKTDLDLCKKKFDSLYHKIKSDTDILLHNIGVDLSHRTEISLDNKILEKARVYNIIDNLLINVDCNNDEFIEDLKEDPWSIPEDWKKINTEKVE